MYTDIEKSDYVLMKTLSFEMIKINIYSSLSLATAQTYSGWDTWKWKSTFNSIHSYSTNLWMTSQRLKLEFYWSGFTGLKHLRVHWPLRDLFT